VICVLVTLPTRDPRSPPTFTLSTRLPLALHVHVVVLGELVRDEGILRQVHSLCNQLPAIDTEDFRTNLLTEYNDTLLVAYLAAITKGTSQIDSLATKFAVMQDRGGGSAGGSSRHFE
jgi:COP9 signalosome complex subunit 6